MRSWCEALANANHSKPFTCSRMRSVYSACMRMISHSAGSSAPGLSRMLFGTESFPRSWSSAAERVSSTRSWPQSSCLATATATSATRWEWAPVNADLASTMPANTCATCCSVAVLAGIEPWPGSASAISSRSSRVLIAIQRARNGSSPRHASTTAGSNHLPERRSTSASPA